MKCKECSELLIDYMHNELSAELKDMVKDHISSCSKCSKEFEEFAEIKMAAQIETLPEVSSEVLSKLSKAAGKDVKKVRTPFWKKWSYSPILIPTLTTAIALSVWFNFGDEPANFGPEVVSNKQVMTLKAQVEVGHTQSQEAEAVKEDSADEKQEFVLEERIVAAEQNDINKHLEQPQSLEYKQLPALPTEPKISQDPEFREEAKGLAEVDLSKSQDEEPLRQRKAKASPEQLMSSNNQEQEELGLAKSNIQREQYATSSQMKVEDDCEASIRTNEAIINSSDLVSQPVKKRSFKTLAQCYEQKGDYDKAISNYISLEQIAPEESSFANSRIQEIRNRIRLEQSQQNQLSAPQPAN